MDRIKYFIKLSADPPTIVYPYPLIPVFVSIYSENLASFLILIIYSALICSAANLWNHLNDVEEDQSSGSRDSRILIERKKEVILTVIILYSLSYLIAQMLSSGLLEKVLALVPILLTWLYSDKILIYKFLKFRLKEHYIGEIVTYLAVFLTCTLILFLIAGEINSKNILISFILTIFYLSIIVLKDLKDLSTDESFGYKTFAVAFGAENTIKISTILNAVYYFALFGYAIRFDAKLLLAILPVSFLIYFIFRMRRLEWKISLEDVGLIKAYVFSYISSIVLLSMASIINVSIFL